MHPNQIIPQKKLLIVLSYYDGDADAAISLLKLITDLQPERTKLADILLFRRNDARPINDGVTQPMLGKFDNVHQRKCRRMNASGYPYGPNEMFYDLLEMLRREEWQTNYFAFLNMETDCVPLNPDWIRMLCDEYKQLSVQGAFAVGHVNADPEHLNGSAIYSIDFWQRAGGMAMIGGSAKAAYDIEKRSLIMPLAKDTPLMLLDFNRKTISATDLFSLTKASVKPVYFHGVKDASARTAVRAFFIEKRGLVDLSRRTISTYYDVVAGVDQSEQKRCIDIWREAWSAAGWNTVVNTLYDAQKHPLYRQMVAKAKRLPSCCAANYDLSCYLRWLAFDYQGGGVTCDYDLIPRRHFSPDLLPAPDGFTVLQYRARGLALEHENLVPSFVMSDRAGLKVWIDYLINAEEKSDGDIGGRPHTSDMYILNRDVKLPWIGRIDMVRDIGEDGWEQSQTVHFCHDACRIYSEGTPKSSLMLNFFRSAESK
jgi:hypothetical protein